MSHMSCESFNLCSASFTVWSHATCYMLRHFSSISKEDVPTWCKQFYYDFFLINGLYMFRTFTCPSSGVPLYRLFHCRGCGVFSQGITPHAAVKQPIYKNSWRWTCKCPKHVEAIYEKKIREKNHSKIVCIKLVHLPCLYIWWCTVTLTSNFSSMFDVDPHAHIVCHFFALAYLATVREYFDPFLLVRRLPAPSWKPSTTTDKLIAMLLSWTAHYILSHLL